MNNILENTFFQVFEAFQGERQHKVACNLKSIDLVEKRD
jgi:hypothetical protein